MELAISQAQEAMAKQLRVSKQQRLLKSRGGEMLRRGLRTLDELEEAEASERAALAKAARLPASPSTTNSGVPDPELDFSTFDHAALSPSYWPNWGVDGGTPPTTLGS
ncbi:hypothetical protein V500_10134 [Pseudogymnoascus sp. VKM F-4518 (FW-2643)]|nr:hypothetical protein V500_10134 [Pseudogymnoascus sp. VKM F-4518 (FW-2643)]